MMAEENSNPVSATVVICNRLGMHARAAAQFVKVASKYGAEIMVVKDTQRVNGKSIMGILTLVAPRGTPITIWAQGKDAELALAELSGLVERKFGEE